MKNLKLLPILLLLTACGALGIQQPQSFNDRAGYAIATHTAVIDATVSALNFGDITSAEAESVAEISDQARKLIDTALRIKVAGDTEGADKTLGAAVAILTELQTYLRRRSQ